jgi:uncharacterized protein (TIGR03437 family)
LSLPFLLRGDFQSDVKLDFSSSQTYFRGPVDGGLFAYRATNSGTSDRAVSQVATVRAPAPCFIDVSNPQGLTVLKPGESMVLKLLFGSCASQLQAGQIVKLTLDVVLAETQSSTDRIAFSKDLTFEGLGNAAPGNVKISGVVVDTAGAAVSGADVWVQVGTAWVPAPPQNSSFTFSVASAPQYSLRASKPGFDVAFVQIDAASIQPSYKLVLKKRADPVAGMRVLGQQQGNLGFWTGAATDDETRFVMITEQENYLPFTNKQDGKLTLLDVTKGSVIWEHPLGWVGRAVDISGDGAYVAFGTASKVRLGEPAPKVGVVDGKTGEALWTRTIDNSQYETLTMQVKLSHDAHSLLVGIEALDNQNACLLSAQTGATLWCKPLAGNMREFRFTKDDQFAYVSVGDGFTYKLATAGGHTVWRQWVGSWAFVNGFRLSKDEQYLCVGTKSGDVTLLRTSDGSIRFHKEYESAALSCDVSPDNATVAVSGGMVATYLYDLDGRELWAARGRMMQPRFSADGQLVGVANNELLGASGAVRFRVEPDAMDPGDSQIAWANSSWTRLVTAGRDIHRAGENVWTVYQLDLAGQLNAPLITADGIVGGADYQARGSVSPGELISLFGTKLNSAGPAGMVFAADGTVATMLANTRVWVAGIPSPLLYAAEGQVNAVAPFGMTQISNGIDVAVERNPGPSGHGTMSNAVRLRLTAANPAIIAYSSDGRMFARALNQDYSINSSSNPAAAGSVVVLYAIGFGATNPPGVDGQVAGMTPPQPVARIHALVDNQECEVLYAGGAYGLVAGVFQVNVKLPDSVPAGGTPGISIQVEGGGQSMPVGLFVR